MPGQQLQPAAATTALESIPDRQLPAEWQGGAGEGPAPTPSGPNLTRYASALGRFKWLIVLFGVVGLAGGYAATRFIPPEYQVQATILLEQGTGTSGGGRGPIQADELLRQSGWEDLLRSFAIADPVVNDLALFVEPARDADTTVFRAFRVDQQQRLRPGDYALTITGNRYMLALKAGIEVERGVLGDSIGRPVGFRWQPEPALFSGRKYVEFKVMPPRDASLNLIKKLGMRTNDGSSFIFLTLKGENAQRTAQTLNAWVEQFVAVAMRLKKQKVAQLAGILEGQREYAMRDLQIAEAELESFRVRTVTQPNERQTIAPGLEMKNSPVFDTYFRNRLIAEQYKRDREALEAIQAQRAQNQPISREAVLSIPAVTTDPAAENLRKVLAEQSDRETRLRRLRESYSDEFQAVKNEVAALQALDTTTLPGALEAYLTQLRLREKALNLTVEEATKDLKGIPTRTIEEQRLKRRVEVSAEMYKNLNLKAAEAKLADAATIPDVSILDAAVPPLKPTSNTAPMITLAAFAGALLLGCFLAILLDQLDRRFRYPEQATQELGLSVLGVVPVIGGRRSRSSADQAAQVVETFRTIRMNVRYAAPQGRSLTLTLTSPGPNDGKSLIASNLALSFAESGARTLLIDGDIRRGELAKTFGVRVQPGLVEYLDGTALIAEVLQPTQSHPNLTVMPGGARRRRAPELLASNRLPELIAQMAAEYDVVLVDSPPLGAGFDAYALGTATGNLALVLRAGVTDRRMAEAKLAVVDTLPIRVLGTVLNGIRMDGVYQYYSYYQDYEAMDDDEEPEVAPPVPAIEPGSRRRRPPSEVVPGELR